MWDWGGTGKESCLMFKLICLFQNIGYYLSYHIHTLEACNKIGMKIKLSLKLLLKCFEDTHQTLTAS